MITENVVSPKIRPFYYRSVELTESSFRHQFEEMLRYFLAIPNDDMLVGFRKRAGLPAPGNELGGWYSNESSSNVINWDKWDECFNTFGQWLSLFARAYSITGDGRVRDKAESLLTEWSKTIEDDGYFFYSNACNGWHYAYEKMLGGLVDLYLYAGLENAKTQLDKITGWAENNLPRSRYPAIAERYGIVGKDPTINGVDNEWYTLSENLYRMYLASGDERYRDFAKVWHYDYYWDGLAKGHAYVMTKTHGYSHVNCLGGAVYAYRVLGDERYLDAVRGGYELLRENQLLASGGFAFDEVMADHFGSNYQAVERYPESFEVACGTWAGFKLSTYLLSLTGEARYGGWAETLLYNAIGASLPMKDDHQRRGKTFYYANYRMGGGRKVYYHSSFPCCSGTYPQAVAEYHNLIYYQGEDTLYISQYLPSRVKADIGGRPVEVEIAGDYPRQDRFRVKVGCGSRCRIALRMPEWIRPGGTLTIAGRPLDIPLIPGEWAVVDRDWSDGGELEVVFPMGLRTYPISKEHPERAALLYGPILLSAVGKHRRMAGSISNPEGIAVQRDGLTFAARDPEGNEVLFRPLYSFAEREWYTTYMDFDR